MEMDSPFEQEHIESISVEGENLKILKEGETIMLTCRVFGMMYENTSEKFIEWLKDEKSLNFKVRQIFLTIIFKLNFILINYKI